MNNINLEGVGVQLNPPLATALAGHVVVLYQELFSSSSSVLSYL